MGDEEEGGGKGKDKRILWFEKKTRIAYAVKPTDKKFEKNFMSEENVSKINDFLAMEDHMLLCFNDGLKGLVILFETLSVFLSFISYIFFS
jgi:hypothetical protein